MRTLLALCFALAFTSVQAGVLDNCRQQSKNNDALRDCVRAERVRSINQLHEASKSAERAVMEKTRDTRRKNLLREYRNSQARHVRERSNLCRKQGSGIEQIACEADMNYAQVEKLTHFTEQP